MTVKEFKEQHPELSHLEGNELWNAMEDHMVATTSNISLRDFFTNPYPQKPWSAIIVPLKTIEEEKE